MVSFLLAMDDHWKVNLSSNVFEEMWYLEKWLSLTCYSLSIILYSMNCFDYDQNIHINGRITSIIWIPYNLTTYV